MSPTPRTRVFADHAGVPVVWEVAESLPPAKRSGQHDPQNSGRIPFTLEPGEIVRRMVPDKGYAGGYAILFRRTGRADYHAGIRKLDGIWWLYVWRDA